MAKGKKGDGDIVVRSISASELNSDLNTAVGLSANGSVHPVETLSEDGPVTVKFYTESGGKLPREYWELLVKNAELNLEGLSKHEYIRMASRIAEIKTYLELIDKANIPFDPKKCSD